MSSLIQLQHFHFDTFRSRAIKAPPIIIPTEVDWIKLDRIKVDASSIERRRQIIETRGNLNFFLPNPSNIACEDLLVVAKSDLFLWWKLVYRHAAPLASITSEALGGEAGLLADDAFWVAGQVALPPVVRVPHRRQFLARQIRRVLLAVRHRKVLAVRVNKVLAYWNRIMAEHGSCHSLTFCPCFVDIYHHGIFYSIVTFHLYSFDQLHL